VISPRGVEFAGLGQMENYGNKAGGSGKKNFVYQPQFNNLTPKTRTHPPKSSVKKFFQ